MYEAERVKVNKRIDDNIGRIAITTDMWTATTQKKGYMSVTAHYIDNNWHLRRHMLRFIYVPAPHATDNLADELVKCMLKWNVDAKLSSVTLNNCSINDKMMEIIKSRLVASYLLKGGVVTVFCPGPRSFLVNLSCSETPVVSRACHLKIRVFNKNQLW
ncbi:Putative AC9 transposase [Linum perenne]